MEDDKHDPYDKYDNIAFEYSVTLPDGTLSVDNDPDANHYHKIGPVLKETAGLDIHDARER